MSSPTCGMKFQLSLFRSASDISPELADLIEFDRTLYTHWGIYVGNGDVVHIVGEDDEDLPDTDYAIVRRTSLESLGGDSFMRVNNKSVSAKERSLTPFDNEQVVAKALSMVGSKVEYNLIHRNAEHYLTDWKYGHGWSCQASVALSAITALKKDTFSGHSILVNALNSVLSSPGTNMPSSPSLRRSALTRSESISTSCQTEPTHVK